MCTFVYEFATCIAWQGRWAFSDEVWAAVSDDAKTFIRSLLRRNPSRRPSALALLQNPWVGPQALCSFTSMEAVHHPLQDHNQYCPGLLSHAQLMLNTVDRDKRANDTLCHQDVDMKQNATKFLGNDGDLNPCG